MSEPESRPNKVRPSRRLLRAGVIVVLTAAALGGLVWAASVQRPRTDPFATEPSVLSARWFLEPMERNRFLRLPAVVSDLYSVTFAADGKRGWAVGADGTIVATTDGGNTWQAQASGTKAELWSVTFAADGKRGWAVGGDLINAGTIIATADGGNTWQPQTSGAKAKLMSVTFAVDGKRGWAVGDQGTIVATADGGNTWKPQAGGTKDSLRSVSFAVDGKRGWAVGEDGIILATTDGGTTWQPQTNDTRADLNSVTFAADGKRGWAVGSGGTIVATADGGNTWEPQFSVTLVALRYVTFAADGRRGWAVGDDGTIVATDYGGKIWRDQSRSTSALLRSVMFSADGERGWAVGNHGTILATTDTGNTWQPQTIGTKTLLFSVTFAADGKRGWAVGDAGTILATTDAGNAWQAQTSGTETDLWSVTFAADGKLGWAVGNYGTIVATADAGSTWRSRTTGPELRSVTFAADGKHGWAVGNYGTIVATADGGNTWRSRTTGTETWLMSVTFAADGKHGWAVAGKGTIVATTDGGNTWQSQTSGTKAGLSSVTFAADGKSGCAVGEGGTIVATADGGNTWQSQTSGTTAWLHSVTFAADGKYGWAVGTDGTIVTTADGGNTWQPRVRGTTTDLMSVTFAADGKRGWVVGRGIILTTRDGGNTWVAATYRRSPAPWFYLASFAVLALAVVALFWNRRPQDQVKSIEDKGLTDQPITKVEDDRLGFADLARGLDRYLRNAATRPPLILGLNAPWGRGKSSVMNMLRTQLERAGGRSVWFNAWHHQKEDVSLAALLASVCEQALPPCLTWLGLRFRARLLWQRVRRRPLRWLLCLALLLLPLLHPQGALAGAELLGSQMGDLLPKLLDENLLGFLSGLLVALAESPENLVASLSLLLFLAGVVVVFIYGLRAFPDSPAVLLASLSKQFKVSDAKAQTSFRQSFRRDFSEVCQALRPRTLTVFIDDLDRCEPAKTAEMLEAVNYLVDSGECFVVLGMARNVVEAQLAHHYRDLADAWLRVKKVDGEKLDAPPDKIPQEDKERVAYARNYLRKLINLEIYIPSLTDAQAKALLEIEVDKEKKKGWQAGLVSAYEAIAGWWQCHWKAVLWSLSLATAVVAGMVWVVPGVEQWYRGRLDRLESGRMEATGKMAQLQEAEQQANIALDFAKGREQAAAKQVFEKSGIPVAGLKLDWPPDQKAAASTVADVCDENAPAKALPDSPANPVTTEIVVRCWRERALAARAAEAKLAELAKHKQAAEQAKARDHFQQLGKEVSAAETAKDEVERAAGLSQKRTLAPTPSPGPVGPREGDQHSTIGDTPIVEFHHEQPPTWPLWLPVAMLLVLATGSILFVREDYVIRDAPSFVKALGIWAPVITADRDLAAPREIKRFINKARYFAMRLRPQAEQRNWLRRLLLPELAEDPRTKISEADIVALTALEHLHPEWFAPPRGPEDLPIKAFLTGFDAVNERDNAITAVFKRHTDEFRSTPVDSEKENIFFAVVGEYTTHTPIVADAKPSSPEPNQASPPTA